MKSDFLTPPEILEMGFASVGSEVRISRHALFFGPERISIGDNTRIDAFCVLSAGSRRLAIGSHVHIGTYTAILGRADVEIGDYASISARCLIYSSNDDYSGAAMAGPTVPDEYRNTVDAPVIIHGHAMIGAGCILLPGITIGESAGVGAASLVKEDVAPFTMVAGVPARVISRRTGEHRVMAERLNEIERRDPPRDPRQ